MANDMSMDDLRGQMSRSGDFAAPAPQQQGASVVVAGEREVAEVKAAMAIAKRFPRDERAAMDRVLNACSRPGLAEAALYTYARGGTEVTGPSIRMAEALAQSWGNLQVGVRELDQENGVSTVETYAWDLETNFRESKVFQVAHERHTKAGVKRLTDPRDIYELVANQGARRLRACILAVIPGDVIDAAVNQCEVTLRAKDGDVTPEVIKKLLEAFAGYGVTKPQIEKFLQRSIEAITPSLVARLRKIFNSMKDGISKPEEWFEAPTVAEAMAAKKAPEHAPAPAADPKPAPEKQKPAKAHKEAPPKPAEEAPAAAAPAEVPPSKSGMPYEDWVEAITTADTVDQLNGWGAKLRETKDLSPDQVKTLKIAAGKRAGEIASKAYTGGDVE